jgi:3-oxoacyl-[acyl-carrier protein] reductase
MSVSGKATIVTGGANGIGKGIASVFVENGADVAIVDVDVEAAEATASELETEDTTVTAVEGDVTDLDSMNAAVDAVADEFGGVDVLVANTGIYPSATLEEMDVDDWDTVHDVNLKGMFLSVKASLPYLKESENGRVLLTSSITGPMTGYPGWSHYGASKAGMLGFMRTAAMELAADDITVNAVLPGNIHTGSLDDLGEEYLDQMRSNIPLGELGDTADIGNAMAFLGSDEAGYITGQTLVVDGGQTLPESSQALESIGE